MQQIAFNLTPVNSYDPKEFISSASNIDAYNKIKNWENEWGILPYRHALLVYGPKSSGKTYLARIWQSLSGAFLIDNNHVFHEDLLNNYSSFVIENIEDRQEEDLLHHFNSISEKQKYLLMTTSTLDLDFKLKDLSSRISSNLRLEIKQPDDELMKTLLFKLFSNHSIQISNKILNFLLVNLTREFSKIIEFVDKVNQLGLISKRSITLKLIKQVLNQI
jgi:chromosomal replication initiation ATPase DnaA